MKRGFLLLGVAVGLLWAVCNCRRPDVAGQYYDIIPAGSRGVCAIHVNRLIEKGEITQAMKNRPT